MKEEYERVCLTLTPGQIREIDQKYPDRENQKFQTTWEVWIKREGEI